MRILTLLPSLAIALVATAGTPPSPAMMDKLSPAPAGFEENKGQVRTMEGHPAPYVRYRLSQGNTQIFLLGNGIAYQFKRTHHPEGYAELASRSRHDDKELKRLSDLRDQVRIETCRMDMILDGADVHAHVTSEGESADFANYYNHDVLGVRTYQKVTYHDVYPGIDWLVYITEGGMKQDFVVHPGADPKSIKMHFEHHEELAIDGNGALIHGNRMGRFTEEPPVSFQDGKVVRTRFRLSNGTVSFDLDPYDPTRTLTIDPDRVWATYYGGADAEEGLACAVDGDGNVYLAGWTGSTSNIASGGYQITLAGTADAFLVKFDGDGTRLWGTYYGGGGNEVGFDCATDASGNVYLAGYTESNSGIASGGHQGTYAGGQDGFLVKFASDGTRIWGTYYGGAGFDNAQGCAVDANGNVYLTGKTASTTGITVGGHQSALGGVIDGYLVKFNPSGTRQWATYYGGSDVDEALECAVNAAGVVFISGGTTSSNGIASNGHQNTHGGGLWDTFLAAFNSSGTRLWGTYYGGSDLDDYGSCATDADGNVFLAGSTNSTSGIASGGFQSTYGGNSSPNPNFPTGDAFLVKFNSSGVRQWGTYFGGPGIEVEGGCATDDEGNVYIRGQSTSSGLEFEGYPSSGGGAFYLAKFSGAGARLWATYYGINGFITGGNANGIATGENEVVYFAGTTSASSGIAFNGFQNTNSDQSAFLVRFGYGEPPTVTTSPVGGSPFCAGESLSVPFTITGGFQSGNTFTAQLSNASGSFSSPISIGTLSGTSAGSVLATIPPGTAPGTGYRIRVISSDPDTIGTDNGSSLTINNPSTSCICALDAEAEPNNSATQTNPMVAGVAKSGSMGACIAADNSSDYFSFTAASQGVLQVQACLSNTGPAALGVTFHVVSSSGNTLGTYVLQAGANKQAVAGEFLFPCLGTESYRIAIDNPSTSYCTFYSITYSILPPLFENDVEPNNGIPGTSVELNTFADGRVQFDGDNSFDSFNIVPPTNGQLNIEVQAEHAGGSTGTMDVVLLSSTGTTLQTWSAAIGANGTATTTTLSMPCRSSTTNYNVRFASTTCGVSYRWKYTMTAPLFANDTEPNNTVGGSIESDDTWYAGQAGFDNQIDDDIFTLAPPSSGVMNIEVEAEHVGGSPGTVTVALLSAAGAVIQSWSMTAGANGIAAATMVNVPCRNGSLNYNLRFTPVTCGVSYRWKYTMTAPLFANDTEPNNGAPGNSLAHDTYTQGQVQFDGDTYDYYAITPPTNGVMNFSVEAEHVGATTGAMELALLSSAGTVIQTWPLSVGANGVPQASAMSITCRSTTDPYRVRITATTCGVSYRLKYTMTPPVFAADAEPNDTQPGTPLSANTYTEGQIAFDGEINFDLYRIGPLPNGMLSVELQAEHAGATPSIITIQILSTAGVTLQTWNFPVGANGVPVTTTLSRTCLPGAAAFDLLMSSSVCGVSYKLRYTHFPPVFADDIEPNNATGQAIILPETQTAQGQLNFGGDNGDYYRLNLLGQGIVNISVQAEHAGPETSATLTLQLYNSSGSLLQTWTAPIGAASIPISSVRTRTCMGHTIDYYLRISSSICLTSYQFSYTVTAPPFANDIEPNQSSSQAIVAATGINHEGHLTFDNDNNFDYFRLQAPNDGVMTVSFLAEHAGAAPATMTLYLRNSSNSSLHTWTVNVGANGVPVLNTFTHTCTGTENVYYLEPYSPSVCGVSYRFNFTVAAPMYAGDAEPNQSTGAAVIASAGTNYDGHLDFDYGDNYDYFRLQTPNDGVMTVSFLAEHAGAAPATMTLYLRNSSNSSLHTWALNVGANGVPVLNTFTHTCTGTENVYYLEPYSPSVCGVSYRFNYMVAAPMYADDAEPNQGTTAAVIANTGTDYDGRLDFDYDDNFDYFRLQAPNDGVMTVSILAEHAGATPATMTVYLRSSSNAALHAWTANVGANGVPVMNTFTHTCTGTENVYYLEPYSPSVCGVSYRFNYLVTAPLYADDTEPNPSTAQCSTIDLNAAPADGRLAFEYDNNSDYWRIIHPGGPINVYTLAEQAGAGGTMTVYIRNSVNSALVTNSSVLVGGNSIPALDTTTLSSAAAGTYYIEVYSPSLCGVSYRLKCYDDDQDGVCNISDVCPGGPEPGTPCDDGDADTINDVITGGCTCAGISSSTVSVPVRVMLEGPYDPSNGLMFDALRGLPAFPATDPYPALGYAHTGGATSGSASPAVLSLSGADAITDWVLVEIRSAVAPATVVASRSALLQRDGDVVQLDGVTPVSFSVSPGLYHVAVRHRNHLGAMTKDPVMLSAGTALLDFADPGFDTYGIDARTSIAGSFPAHVLWSGDVSFDGVIRYVGQDNDRDPILVVIGGSVPTNTVVGVYSTADCDLDGTVKYVGEHNDRDPILVNIGGSIPTNTRQEQLP